MKQLIALSANYFLSPMGDSTNSSCNAMESMVELVLVNAETQYNKNLTPSNRMSEDRVFVSSTNLIQLIESLRNVDCNLSKMQRRFDSLQDTAKEDDQDGPSV